MHRFKTLSVTSYVLLAFVWNGLKAFEHFAILRFCDFSKINKLFI